MDERLGQFDNVGADRLTVAAGPAQTFGHGLPHPPRFVLGRDQHRLAAGQFAQRLGRPPPGPPRANAVRSFSNMARQTGVPNFPSAPIAAMRTVRLVSSSAAEQQRFGRLPAAARPTLPRPWPAPAAPDRAAAPAPPWEDSCLRIEPGRESHPPHLEGAAGQRGGQLPLVLGRLAAGEAINARSSSACMSGV